MNKLIIIGILLFCGFQTTGMAAMKNKLKQISNKEDNFNDALKTGDKYKNTLRTSLLDAISTDKYESKKTLKWSCYYDAVLSGVVAAMSGSLVYGGTAFLCHWDMKYTKSLSKTILNLAGEMFKRPFVIPFYLLPIVCTCFCYKQIKKGNAIQPETFKLYEEIKDLRNLIHSVNDKNIDNFITDLKNEHPTENNLINRLNKYTDSLKFERGIIFTGTLGANITIEKQQEALKGIECEIETVNIIKEKLNEK